MWEKDTFRLPVGADFVILGRRAIADTWRFPRMELDSAARRALLAFRGLVERYESEAIRWLRGTVDLSFDPLTDSCLPANFHGHLGGHSWSVYESWLQELDRRVEMGWVVVTVERRPAIARDAPTFPEFPKPPPPRPESSDTFFDVRFVDETGQAINGLAVEFEAASDLHTATTNPAGVALLEHVVATSATVTIRDPMSLEKILDPRWQKPRNQRAQKRANTTEFVFDGAELPPVSVKPVAEHTVVIKPPLGRLFVELWDKSGRVCHAARDYTISGPMQFSGTTDEQGRLSHDDVFPGEYTLSLTVSFFDGEDEQTDVYDSPLVVLEPEEDEPEVRLIGIAPRAVLVRLKLFFDTNKAFLLPTAFPSIRKLREVYREHRHDELLVVGHADTTGPADFNDALSLDRAKATIAFMKDDVDAWLAFYDSGVPKKKRWGAPEDRMMLISLPDFHEKPEGEDALHWFQRTRNLTVDGTAGPQTRRQLVTEYLALDGASLADEGLDIDATPHGCGESFPLDAAGDAVDSAPSDDVSDPTDRRVELFFFDPEFGIVPGPPGDISAPGSPQYPAWRARAEELDLEAEPESGPTVTFAELIDAHFRTSSAVLLPEGESPVANGKEQPALTSVGVIATALRFNDEHRGKKVLVAGHTDTEGSTDFNRTLSGERAKCALGVLAGGDDGREAFKSVADGRHQVSDIKQILAWVSRAFDDLTFDCDPGAIDDDAGTLAGPVSNFQSAYNDNKDGLGASGPDLAVDGDVGPLTWGAIFDCYELALRQELGEDAEAVSKLREKLTFVDDEHRAIGFGEYFPIDELGVDDFRSETNRRVEILFFDHGEEPDTEHAAEDPETSELYLPGNYLRAPLPPMLSAKRSPYVLRLHVETGEQLEAKVKAVVTSDDGSFTEELDADESSASEDGFVELTYRVPPAGTFTLNLERPGANPVVVFAGVPFAELAAPTSPSVFVQTESGDPFEPSETLELQQVYRENGQIL